MDRKVFSVGAVLMIGLFLSGVGCVNLGQNGSAPTKFYMLSAMKRPESGVAEKGWMTSAFIGVGPVVTPAYLDRPQIVTRGAGYEVEVADFANWAEPLKNSFGRVLAENLGRELQTETVVVFPWQSEVPVDYQVQLEVSRFDGALGQSAVLDVRWMIYGKPRTKLLVNQHSLIHADVHGPDYGALVRAMSETIQKLSFEIAGEIGKLQ
jgi:uncharacterized lipoprotein YmbA